MADTLSGGRPFSVRSLGSFDIKGRGRVLIVECPVEAPRDHPMQALGTHIEIDGRVYRILGVERFLPTTPIRVGERIGILVGAPADTLKAR